MRSRGGNELVENCDARLLRTGTRWDGREGTRMA